MRFWHVAAATAALLALVLWPAVWTSTRASLADPGLGRHPGASSDDADLVTRVAALETAVAALQTTVATLQPTDTDSAEAEATVVTLETLTCGRPFGSWGAATSDDVRVQLLQLQPGAEFDVAIEGADVYVLELSLDNLRAEGLALDLDDFLLVDCEDGTYPARADGLDPAIAPGEIAPGDSARGWLTFALPPGAQPAGFVYQIQSPNRSGAQVTCPLVDRSAPPASLDDASGGAGCSAQGGSAN